MKSMIHITPLYNALFKNKLFKTGFAVGRSLRLFNYSSQQLSELAWDITLDFPFNPKYIPKLKNRKCRKAAYQSFARYKKSFKPVPEAILKVIRNEWKTDDLVDAISYAFIQQREMTRQDFEKQYMCSWDLASDSRDFSVLAKKVGEMMSWENLKNSPKGEIPDYAEFRGIRVAIDKGTK